MYDLADEACAQEFNVSLKTYIKKIENTTIKRAEVITSAVFSEDPKLIKKAQRIFNLIN